MNREVMERCVGRRAVERYIDGIKDEELIGQIANS